MPEINFSKKQLAPLIQKFGIDVEKNTLFHRVIHLFSGQPNYHVWAVKAVFGGVVKVEELERIKAWADANPKHIQYLSKNGNIVSYTTRPDFDSLFVEIDGINKKMLVNDVISTFNTDQRKMLKSATRIDAISNVDASVNREFNGWYNLLLGFSRLNKNRKSKVIRSLSAVRNMSELKNLIDAALKETYTWDKESMLTFVQYNCPNVDIIYNVGPIVVLEIPTYQDSHKICYGRTSWCITRSSDYFKQYVTDKKGNRQFFFFDFSKNEKHDLAHVGFTLSPNNGITNAHSTTNVSMTGSGCTIDGSTWNIQRVLSENNIQMSIFMQLKQLKGFSWNLESFAAFAGSRNGLEIVFQRGNIVIVKVKNSESLNAVIGFTFIPVRDIMDKQEAYLLMNFDAPVDSNSSVVFMQFKKDIYGTYSPRTMYNTYGANCLEENPVGKLGISTTDFINCGPIDPNILLHKYIDEKAEAAAIKLLEEQGDKIDVNFKFNNRVPIFSAIDNKLFGLFSKIILNDNFDGSIDGGFGENLVQLILWSCYIEDDKLDKGTDDEIRNLVINMLESGKFNVNDTDINDDTLLHIAAQKPNMLWLVDYLVRRPDIDVNIQNDINMTAFDTALHNNNIECARLIGMRTDLAVSDFSKEIAKENRIDLKNLINPTKLEDMGKTSLVNNAEQVSYHEVLSKIFSNV